MNWTAITAAFACAVALTGGVRALALRAGLLDVPNDRSSHAGAIPRGGGIAIVLVTLAGLVYLSKVALIDMPIAIGLGGAAGGIALVSWFDDRHGLSAPLRLGVQVLALLWFAVWCIEPLINLDGAAGSAAWLWRVLLFAALLWAVNLFNFMDGIDGLAGGQGVFMAAMSAWLVSQSHGARGFDDLLAILAAASAGFLAWNVSPARIFLGDVGSCFLGFMLAAIMFLISATSPIPLATWAIVSGVFLVDATLTLCLRILRHEQLTVAHRSHLYQRLAISWGSHLRVTALYLAVNVLWLSPLAIWSAVSPAQSVWIAALALSPLVLVGLKFRTYGRP